MLFISGTCLCYSNHYFIVGQRIHKKVLSFPSFTFLNKELVHRSSIPDSCLRLSLKVESADLELGPFLSDILDDDCNLKTKANVRLALRNCLLIHKQPIIKV